MKMFLFGAAAALALVAAPTSAHADCLPQNFIMFYDWGHPDMPEEAWATVNAALTQATQQGCRLRSLEIDGNMDHEFDPTTNQSVAEHRVQEMIDYLVRQGAPRSLIQSNVQIGDHGEFQREPLQRRVEVLMDFY
jgi:hypothetical protein